MKSFKRIEWEKIEKIIAKKKFKSFKKMNELKIINKKNSLEIFLNYYNLQPKMKKFDQNF